MRKYFGHAIIFRHLTSTTQIERHWLESELFPMADQLRDTVANGHTLDGKSLYCLFYEPSFLTRTSFERAIDIMGGRAYHTEDASQFFPVNTPRYIDSIIGMLASLHIDLVVLRSSEPGIVDTAAEADALPIVNGGSSNDHPTQAMADLYTLRRELGAVDGKHIAVVGRLEHRNVNALLRGLALFDGVRVTLMPLSGQAEPEGVRVDPGLVALDGAASLELADPLEHGRGRHADAPRNLGVGNTTLGLKNRQDEAVSIIDHSLTLLIPR